MNNTTLGTAERQARAFGIALVAITTIVAGISVIVAATGVLEPSAEQIRVQKLLDARVACYNDIRRTDSRTPVHCRSTIGVTTAALSSTAPPIALAVASATHTIAVDDLTNDSIP